MSLRPASLLLGVLLATLAAGPVAAQAPAPAPAPAPPAPAAPVPPAAPAAPATGQVLTLQEAIQLALRQQPTIRSAEESRNAATARVPQAQSTYYPRLDASAFLGRAQTFSTNSNTTQRSDSFNASLQARQLLYDFGKTGALVDEARAGVRFSEFELERVREVVVLNVRQSYLQLVQAQRLTAVADAQVARAELNLRSARGFFDVGTKPRFDVTRAEVELANARVAQIRARNLVQLNQVGLANALGLPATTPIEVQDILVYEPIALDRESLRTEALGNRPELAQAQARIEAARAQVSGAKSRYFPDLAATGSVGGVADEPTTNIFTQDTWSIGASLQWNLFEGFFTKYRVKETESLLAAARANYDSLELQVRLDVEQAYIAVVEAAERTGATGVAVDSARENLRLAQGRYDAGVGTILDLTDSQLALTNAEADQVRALTDHKLALAALDRAVGRP
jgi:TolC family type I secretion outer membrane protein